MSDPRGSAVIGIGVDAVDVPRFRATLSRTPSLRDRVFTDAELVPLADRSDPVPSLAARFAAREAVMKAMGVGLGAFDFHDVWVDRLDTGRPVLQVSRTRDRIVASVPHAHRRIGDRLRRGIGLIPTLTA